jgi:cyclase
MQLPRIIPCLLLQHGVLVKTQRFNKPDCVGDPITTVRIYNERGADELIFLDIAVTPEGANPQFELIEKISRECYMPFA